MALARKVGQAIHPSAGNYIAQNMPGAVQMPESGLQQVCPTPHFAGPQSVVMPAQHDAG